MIFFTSTDLHWSSLFRLYYFCWFSLILVPLYWTALYPLSYITLTLPIKLCLPYNNTQSATKSPDNINFVCHRYKVNAYFLYCLIILNICFIKMVCSIKANTATYKKNSHKYIVPIQLNILLNSSSFVNRQIFHKSQNIQEVFDPENNLSYYNINT